MRHGGLLLSTILLFLFAYLLQTTMFFSSDVEFLILATKRLLAGGSYSQQFFETNPPMILYLYTPIAWLANHTGWDTLIIARSYFFGLIILSSYLSYTFLQKLIPQNNPIVFYTTFYAMLCGLLLIPAFELGQREHIFTILIMPYLFAAAIRLEHMRINPGKALLVGIMAGLGFALKPFFLATLACIELYFIIKKHRLFGWVRIESIVIASVLVLYLASIFLFYPDYLYAVLPRIMRYYFVGATQSWSYIFSYPSTFFCLLTIVFYLWFYKNNQYKTLGNILCLALLGATASFLIARSVWFYHTIPGYIFGMMIIAFCISQLIAADVKVISDKSTRLKYLSIYVVVSFILLFIPLRNHYHVLKFVYHDHDKDLNIVKVIDYLDQLPHINSISCFTLGGTEDCFPLIYKAQSEYGGRYPFYWWYTGLRKKEHLSPTDATLLADKAFFIESVAEDLDKYKTEWVVVNTYNAAPDKKFFFDFVTYFSQDEMFKKAWLNYHYVKTIDNYVLYQRNSQVI